MRKIGVSMNYGSIWYNTALIQQSNMQNLSKIAQFSSSDIAKFRLGVIEFHEKYGTKATRDAYGLSKATIYRWRQKYLKERKENASLIPKSRKPKRIREMQTDYRIVTFIRQLRMDHRRIGKEKIYPLLCEYCDNEGIKPIKTSTIGKVIKRHNLFFQKKGRIYHDPSINHTKRKISYKTRSKYHPRSNTPGFFQIDTVTRYYNGKKVYVVNGIDIYTRFSFAYAYKSLNSSNAADYLSKLMTIYTINKVQTDNGLEFHGAFHDLLEKHGIEHLFTYPRCPKVNGTVERCNRSLSEEFLEDYLIISDDIPSFNHSLIEYIIWYNTKRIHKSLKNQTPMDFILQNNLQSHMYMTHTKY